jgi:hypothetical protein
LLYIDPIEGWDQSLRRRPVAVAVVVLAAIVVPLAGCGGSDEQTTGGGATTATGGGSTSSKDAATGQVGGVPTQEKGRTGAEAGAGSPTADRGGARGADAGRRHSGGSRGDQGGSRTDSSPGPKQAESTAPAGGQKSSGTVQPSRKPDRGATATGIEGASPVVVKKLRKRCPKGMDPTACDEFVKTYLEAQNPPPAPPQPEPGQCPESLSQAECEAAIAAVKASEKGSSVSLEECLANMTPRCEETLRPAFEAQKQAEEQAGE